MTVYLSPADYDRLLTKPKRSKYHAKQVIVTADGAMVEAHVAKAHGLTGERFDSKAEGSRYLTLKALERAGRIRDLERQPGFTLHGLDGSKLCTYRADFRHVDVETGRTVITEVKGFPTPLWKLKRKLVESEYGVAIEEVK
jgi:hypothetical protein